MGAMNTSKPYKGMKEGRSWNMTLTDVQRIRNTVAEVDIVTATNTRWGRKAVNKDKSINVSISGEYPEYLDISNPRLRYGRRFNDVDIVQRRKVCIVGSRIVEELFPGEEKVCGRRIQIDGIYYTIIGQSGRTGNSISLNGNALTTIEIPYTTMQQAYSLGNNINMLCFTARKGFAIADVQQKAETVIKRAHNIHPNDTQAVFKLNAEAMFKVIDNLFNGIGILIWMIGLGTLLSGAIGVSNIMMVTVKERTIEIGIRRAIGATPMNILRQILSESMLLTLIAGLSGISFSVFILHMVETAVNSTPDAIGTSSFQISFWLAIGAALIIALLGLIAGIAPALRAMHIRPVDAMRDE
jgi:putative ABC transport system permease protein